MSNYRLKKRSLSQEDLFNFSELFKLMKPRVMSLVIFTCAVGLLTAPNLVSTKDAIIGILLVSLGAGAAGALNMWYESDLDALMTRTCLRPIPTGKVNRNQALIFGVTLSIISVLALDYFTNRVSASILLLTILFYVFVYTIWLKRRTVQNIVIGGLAGSTPPLIGWFVAMGPSDLDLHSMNGFLVSITDTGSLVPFYMLGVIFLWTPPHFWALALYKSDEYRQVGVPMLPWVKGSARTLAEMRLYGILLLVISLWGPYLIHSGDFSMEYLVLQIGSALIAIWYIRTLFLIPADEVKDENGRLPSAARSFWVSQLFLGLVFLMALAAVSNFAGMVVGLTLSMAVILRSEKKYRSSGFPFS